MLNMLANMLQKACLTYNDDKNVRDSIKPTAFATRVEHNVEFKRTFV